MEVTLKEKLCAEDRGRLESFNPCFNGSDSKSGHFRFDAEATEKSFNPCFNGSDSKSRPP